MALFKERNGFDLIERKWFRSKNQREKARCANNGKVVARWTDDCKKYIKYAEYSDTEIFLKDLKERENVEFLLCKNCCKEETEKTERQFVMAKYDMDVKISDNLTVRLINAGYVPGSACFIFTIDNKKVLFSGDLGSGYSSI